jgi:hypothetical protein
MSRDGPDRASEDRCNRSRASVVAPRCKENLRRNGLRTPSAQLLRRFQTWFSQLVGGQGEQAVGGSGGVSLEQRLSVKCAVTGGPLFGVACVMLPSYVSGSSDFRFAV